MWFRVLSLWELVKFESLVVWHCSSLFNSERELSSSAVFSEKCCHFDKFSRGQVMNAENICVELMVSKWLWRIDGSKHALLAFIVEREGKASASDYVLFHNGLKVRVWVKGLISCRLAIKMGELPFTLHSWMKSIPLIPRTNHVRVLLILIFWQHGWSATV